MINSSNLTTIYVSQKFGDNNCTGFRKEENGDMQGPVKTIEFALEQIGKLRNAGVGQPITIAILDDVYTLDKPIVIDNTVSLVTIKGMNNTIINGGFKIEGFKDDVFNGAKCFSAEVPQVKEGMWFTDLYVDGIRADFTHIPKTGVFEPIDVEDNNKELGTHCKWFIAKPEDAKLLASLKNFSDCIISYNHYWIDEHSPLESVDPETGKVIMKYKSRFSISNLFERSALKYKIENVAEAFENANEWYLDRQTAKVYYIPRNSAQTAENIDVYVPNLQKLFIIKGEKENKVDGVTFKNLTFANTRGDYVSVWDKKAIAEVDGTLAYLSDEEDVFASDSQSVEIAPGAIEFTYAHGGGVEYCNLRSLGLHGITINEGCDKQRIYGNKFFNLGAGGIKVGGGLFGCDKENETFDITISQNEIKNCGRRYLAACGVLLKHAYKITVSHNDISDLFYTGISVGWVWGYKDNISRDNIIEKNHIYNIGQGVLSDMGGIYVLGRQPGTILRGNLIHDVTSFDYGGHGIYTDEGTCYILIENNICYGGNSTGFNQHYGRMNTIRNNIFAKAGEEPVRSSMAELHSSIILDRNIIVSDGTASYRAGYGRQNTGYFHKMCGTNNIHFNTKGEVKIFDIGTKSFSLEEVQNVYGLEDGSIIADPKFKDYENNDFTLSEDSPALAMGFEPIDMSDVGVTIKI
ncbi:MAG: right-handed parallel beta-helix repeat-containing protein [Clostridia bacterium]|nr:right-handed parallel beta-helix repeat-containing protein [Clostridia bacterium]